MPTLINKDPCLYYRLLVTLSSVAVLSLGACGGGMVGTGTGPQDDVLAYQTGSLPERINPDIPRPLLDSSTLARHINGTKESGNVQRGTSARMDDNETADSWKILNRNISEVLRLSLEATETLTLIDTVFPNVLSQCGGRIAETCQIEKGRLGGEYSEELVARLVQIYSAPLEVLSDSGSVPDSLQSGYVAELESRVGTRFEFEAFDYRVLDGQPFDHEVTTSLRGLFRGQTLTVSWNNERTVSTVVVTLRIGDVSNVKTIGFDVNLPGERLTYTEDSQVGSDVGSRFNVTILASADAERRVLVESRLTSRVGDVFGNTAIQGQIDNNSGYTRSQRYSTIGNDNQSIVELREAFNQSGVLTAAEQCVGSTLIVNTLDECENEANFTNAGPVGALVETSALYFARDSFESLESQQDVVRWQTSGLPSDVVDFQVLAADASVSLEDQKALCDGVQFAPGTVQLFCTAPDETLSSTTLVRVDESGNRRVMNGATLIPK